MAAGDEDFLLDVETHILKLLRQIFEGGRDIHKPVDGASPVTWLTEMYMRSSRFPACLDFLLSQGGVHDDPAIASVLLDDEDEVRRHPKLCEHRTSMLYTFTPLKDATMLHVTAEYGCLDAARAPVEMGADIEARAGRDENGLNGHAPLFHTVNSLLDPAALLMELLLSHGARTDVRLRGIRWGKGFDWETTCYDVTPISYCRLGLLPQMQRREAQIEENLKKLLAAAGRDELPPNMPNCYMQFRSTLT